MKTKVILFIGAVALVTLSFTFAGVRQPTNQLKEANSATVTNVEPVGGLYADVVE
jgi:hypothetical protein